MAVATPPILCGWCRTHTATRHLSTAPSCDDCAAETPRQRVNRWLQAVGKGIK